MNLRRTTTAVLAVSCLGLAACSSSGNTTKSSGPTSKSVSPATPASSGESSSGSASGSASGSSSGSASGGGAASGSTGAGGDLAAIGVQRSEVPSSYTAMPAEADDNGNDKVLACIGAKSTKADRVGTVKSDQFSSQTGSVSSEVSRYGSQASVDADAALFKNPKAKSCFSTLLRQAAQAGQSGAKISSTAVDVTPGSNGGPSNVVATISATIVLTANGKRVPVHVDSVYITGPKLEVELTFSGFGTRFDSALAGKISTAVAKRAAAA